MSLRKTALPALAALILSAPAAYAQAPDLNGLHDALRLTAPQESAWRAYSGAIAPDPAAASRRRQAAMLAATLTTPRRVDLFEAEMEEDLHDAQRKGQAVKSFYAQLTPAQQKTFDQMTAPSAQGGRGPTPR